MREKRVTVATWFCAGALAMYFEARAIDAELRDYPGGPAALAKSIMPTIEGMRILRWPADRLDTLGGYLWYHNVTLFTFFLALFAVIQGARTFRHLEEEGRIDFLLATGVSRARLTALRSLAYFLNQLVISVGLGAGTALALAASGNSDTSGAFITLLAGGICIFPFFGLGLLMSQFSRSSRVASGSTSIIVTAVYIATNIAGKYPWLTWLEWISPFSAANRTRPMVPGFGTDYWSWLAMIVFGTLLVGSSVVLLDRRDIHSVVVVRHEVPTTHPKRDESIYVPHSLIGDLLWRQRYGLIAWVLATAAFIGVFIAMMGGIIDVWEKFDFLQQFAMSGFGQTPAQQYLALVYEILPPFIAGFVIAQSGKWTSDLRQGRVQYLMATPLSWTGLVLRRMTTTLLGAEMMIVFALAVATVGSLLQGVPFYPSALVRVFVVSSLFALAFAAACSLLVALLHGRNPTQALSIYVGAAWLVLFMAPYLAWPSWIMRLSIFDALGHPFVAWPDGSRLAAIVIVSVVGVWSAIAVADRGGRTA